MTYRSRAQRHQSSSNRHSELRPRTLYILRIHRRYRVDVQGSARIPMSTPEAAR
jgi:hypothetical protein